MAHKKFGGWIVKEKLFAQVKVANELWYDQRAMGERIIHLFRLGWYERPEEGKAKLYTLTILWVSFQIGVNFSKLFGRTRADGCE